MKYTKDPNATLDYSLEWAEWLGEDTLTGAEWIAPEDLTVESSNFTNTLATVWLSGGTLQEKYTVTCRITTAGGRVDDRSISIQIKEK